MSKGAEMRDPQGNHPEIQLDFHRVAEDLATDLGAKIDREGYWKDYYRVGRCGIDGDFGEQTYWEAPDGTTFYEYCVPRGVRPGIQGPPPDPDRKIWVAETRQGFPDTAKRVGAARQAGGILRRHNNADIKGLLRETYTENDDQQTRIQAGRELGYSSLRIWAHEHPVAVILTGLATIPSLAYMLIRVLGRIV